MFLVMTDTVPADTSGLLLEEQVCFALYSASRAVTDCYRPLLAELNLTYPQYLVLLVLWEHQTRTVKQLSQALELDYGTVSPLLKRLELRGMVSRNRDAVDERLVAVTLTTAGKDLRKQAAGIPGQLGSSTGLNAAGRADLIASLRQLNAAVSAARTTSTTQTTPATG